MKRIVLRLLLLGAFSGLVTAVAVLLSSSPETTGESTGRTLVAWNAEARVVSHQLRGLTDAELRSLESALSADDRRFAPGYEAWLLRPGLERSYRAAAVDALATLRSTDAVTVISTALERLDEEDGSADGDVFHDLAGLLSACSRDELRARRTRLTSLARHAQRAMTRRIGWFGLLRANRSFADVRRLALDSEHGHGDVLACLPMLDDVSLRTLSAELLPHLVETLDAEGSDATSRRLSVDALSWLPGREEEAFDLLAASIRAGRDGDAAIRSLHRIPPRYWRDGEMLPLARSVVEFVEKSPARRRSAQSFPLSAELALLDAVQLGYDLAAQLGARGNAERGREIRRALDALIPADARVALVRTVPHRERYDRDVVAVEAGAPVRLVLDNADILTHNLVVVASDAVESIGRAAQLLQLGDSRRPFVPNAPQVIGATDPVPPRGRAEVRFTAPQKPGQYAYICTIRGRWTRMVGTLVVVADLDAWYAAPTIPAGRTVTETK